MAFVVRVLFLSALAYSANGGLLHGGHHEEHHDVHDSYVSSALNAPSATYGAPAPAVSYGPPAPGPTIDTTHIHSPPEADYAAHGDGHYSAPAHLSDYSGASGPGPALSGPSGPSYSEGSLLLDATLPPRGPAGPGLGGPGLGGPGLGGPGVGGAVTSTSVGAPRVIGTSVSVGRPITSATRYELQSVIQDVIRRVPVEVTRHVQVAVPVPQPYPVRQEVKVPVPQPYPVHVDVVKHVPYDVIKTQHVEVERPVPYEVIRKVPFEVIRKIHIPVERPYEVIKKVHVPVEKAVEVPVAVWKPYPIHIIKHVTHYKKKSCCW